MGLNGQRFQIIKLRSMRVDAEKEGKAVWCVKQDPRVTRLGRVLRKLHLDELPQLLNVAKGEMSLVGPRPERPPICEKLADQIEDYYRRNVVKPGVTGLAQINLPPDETVEDVRRKQILDLRYIEEANFWLDSRMIIATALRMFGFRGVTVIKWMRLCRMHLVNSSPVTVSRSASRLARSWSKLPICRERAFDEKCVHG
jgi:lipopolysaccharide/colanic/teichoic acid biosynthesis glycosyltransferase